MKAKELREMKEEQLREVVDDYGRCHPADAACARRQQLKHEACEALDHDRLEQEELRCFREPGCDYGEACVEMAKDYSERRVDTCTRTKA